MCAVLMESGSIDDGVGLDSVSSAGLLLLFIGLFCTLRETTALLLHLGEYQTPWEMLLPPI